ncbi:hypothetical protein [Sphingobacterium sp.]|uniref:hypothetical protein n=1 Tax=Sphingobacterium sp. TaxID=341027 RepID=UPI00289DD69C|nr:hypothetical protein [Sphingobacterium sp.]
MRTEKITDNSKAIHLTDGSVYTVSMSHKSDDGWSNRLFSFNNSWESDPAIVMGKTMVPYGHNNDLPTVIRKIMDKSNIGPGILERKIGLQYGEGPFLYQEIIDEMDNKKRKPVHDPEIEVWLKSWDFDRYVEIITTEFMHLKGIYTRWYRNKAPRIGGKPKIVKLEPVLNTWARLEWPEHPEKRLENVKNIFVGDFENNCLHSGVSTYPVFQKNDPFKFGVSMSYNNLYSYCRSFYSIPSYYGTLNWLATASEIPDIINYLTDNGISAAFHIHSPQGYWDDKRKKLEDRYNEETDAQIDKRLREIKEELFRSIAAALSGKENAGKFIETVDFYDMDQNLCQWKIEPIDQKIKDFIEAQVKVSEKADSAATSGMGLNPALANLITNNSFSGGSQQLYAAKFHVLTDVNIPERIIFEAVNRAISINWPEKDVKIGFYRKVIMKEDQVSPEKRLTNQV